MTAYSYPDMVQSIAQQAEIVYNMSNGMITIAEAIKTAAEFNTEEYLKAYKHTGIYAQGVTTEEIEELRFRHMVGADQGYRPSVGNVQEALLAATTQLIESK